MWRKTEVTGGWEITGIESDIAYGHRYGRDMYCFPSTENRWKGPLQETVNIPYAKEVDIALLKWLVNDTGEERERFLRAAILA